MTMMGEDIRDAARNAAEIAHVHAADVPGRHEPGTGGIDWTRFLSSLEASGYEGAIGLEFAPLADSTAAAQLAMERMRL
jgi:hydroxypyruvate isomerase